MTKVYQGAPVYQAEVVVEDVLVGLREVVRAEVVVVDVLLAVLDRLKVTLLLLQTIRGVEALWV